MELIDFIIDSKISGYAKNDNRKELKFDDGSKGFQINSDIFAYIDRFYGFNPFCGSEKVFDSKGHLIWRMNYYGKLIENHPQPNKVYSFLREAMALINHEFPFRGPTELLIENMRYENIQNGNINSFYGLEKISESNKNIYQLHYHGGLIK